MINQEKNLQKQAYNKDIEQQKRLRKNIQDLQNQNVDPKKTIVVIGKMGHGKSSFIKMLVSEQDKAKIRSAPDTKSVTNQCSLYQICPQIKLKLGFSNIQNIFIMDTPGLNSNAKNYLIMDQIKKKLILQKCQIISIIYIRKATEFRQQEESNSIAMYYSLPIPKQIKDKITFFVLTHYDDQIKRPKQFEKHMKSLFQGYKQKNLDFLLNKSINWMSFTQEQQDNKILKDDLKTQRFKFSFQKQWSDLKLILKNKQPHKFSYDRLIQISKKFHQLWQQNFKKILKQQKQIKKDQIYFHFQTDDGLMKSRQSLFKQKNGDLASFIQDFILSIKYLFKIDKVERAKKMIVQFQKLKDENQIQKMKEYLSLQDLSIQYVNNYCLQNLKMHIGPKGTIQFQFLNWIEQIIIQSRQADRNQNKMKKTMKWLYKKLIDDSQKKFKLTKYQKRTQENNGVKKVFGYLGLQKNHDYKFIIKIKRPTQNVIVNLIKQTAFEIYGK